MMVLAEFSNAQFRNVRTPLELYTQDQVQPSVAVSSNPDYEWVLAAAWTHLPSAPRHNVGHAVSIDGGLTWEILNDTSLIRNGAVPSIAFDNAGPSSISLHCVFAEVEPVQPGGNFRRIYHTLTEDFLDWRRPFVQVSNSTFGQRDPKIAIENRTGSNRVYVTWWEWTEPQPQKYESRIFFRYSTDRGSSWGPQVVIAEAVAEEAADLSVSPFYQEQAYDPLVTAVEYPDVAVAPNGDVYVAWFQNDLAKGTGKMLVRRSPDGGNTFDPAVSMAELGSSVCWIGRAHPQIRPSLTVSPNGHLFVVTCDSRSELDRNPILRLFRSTNDGSTWIETWRRDSGPGKQDFFPSVVVTPNQRVHITFMHSIAEPGVHYCPDDGIVATWITASDDDGFSFTNPKQVSNEFLIPSFGRWYFDAEAATSFTHDAVFTFWTDHRENYPVPYSASMLTTTLSVPNGWTMSSIPHFMDYYSKANVYPGVDPNLIYIYTPSGYQVAPEPLQDNIGYWIRFPAAGNQRFLGVWKDRMEMPVLTNWNIIGSISSPVDTEDVIQSQLGLVVSWYFEYDGGYIPARALEPGKGYWVKVSANGTLTLPHVYNYSGSPFNRMQGNGPNVDEFVFLDSLGYRQRLFVRSEGKRIEMPPDAPNGTGINVRFASGNFQEIVRPEDGLVRLPIALNRVRYPVTLRWRTLPESGISYWIRNGDIRIPLDTAGNIVIPVRTDGFLRLEALAAGLNRPPLRQTQFSFKGVFPNPFNPSTELVFELPRFSKVSLIVYDVLGRKVATLVDEHKSAGYHSVMWHGKNDNGQAVATGIYFARFHAYDEVGATYTEIDKMLLTK